MPLKGNTVETKLSSEGRSWHLAYMFEKVFDASTGKNINAGIIILVITLQELKILDEKVMRRN